MRLSRILLPPLLTLTVAACAGNAAGGASASGSEAATRSGVTLQNRAEALRLMRHRYPQQQMDRRVAGEVVVQVTLDAAGGVTESHVRRSTHSSFSEAALQVASQLRFSRPAAAGERVNVRMHFADMSRASIAIVD